MLTRQDFNNPQLEFDEYSEKRLRECLHYINLFHPELEENFRRQFNHHYLKMHPEIKMRVMRDFAPLSFYFEMKYWNEKTHSYERDFNGGIIFHSDHDGGGNGGSPTFSVNLVPVSGWATHT